MMLIQTVSAKKISFDRCRQHMVKYVKGVPSLSRSNMLNRTHQEFILDWKTIVIHHLFHDDKDMHLFFAAAFSHFFSKHFKMKYLFPHSLPLSIILNYLYIHSTVSTRSIGLTLIVLIHRRIVTSYLIVLFIETGQSSLDELKYVCLFLSF